MPFFVPTEPFRNSRAKGTMTAAAKRKLSLAAKPPVGSD
jgi:hypothetical protein